MALRVCFFHAVENEQRHKGHITNKKIARIISREKLFAMKGGYPDS